MYGEVNEVKEKLSNARMRLETLKQAAQEVAGCATDRPCKVSLSEQLEKQSYDLAERLERINRLREIMKQHPEFEAYEDFRELMERRNW
jgi:hypothetical protein